MRAKAQSKGEIGPLLRWEEMWLGCDSQEVCMLRLRKDSSFMMLSIFSVQ